MNLPPTRQDRSLQLWFAACLLFMFGLNQLAGLAILFLYGFRLALLSEKIISLVLLNSMAETAAAFFIVNRYLFRCSTHPVGPEENDPDPSQKELAQPTARRRRVSAKTRAARLQVRSLHRAEVENPAAESSLQAR